MGFADISDIAFPWDLLTPFKEVAQSHRQGIIDLSVGTPVDPTPQVIQDALSRAADSHGYPLTAGTPALREAIVSWFERRRNVTGLTPDSVLPTIGSKELVGLLPSLLNLGPDDIVVYPTIAYPTYEVGARLAGALSLPADEVDAWRGNPNVKLVWINSPGNPHGEVADIDYLRDVVEAAREIGALVVSDECYAELPWVEPYLSEGVPSILDPRVVGQTHNSVLVTYSLSKQSNLAGYRAAFVAGDSTVVGKLLAVRKHLGMIVPGPVQAAMVVALGDDAHVAAQYGTYKTRRDILTGALAESNILVSGSQAGLYLWSHLGSNSEVVVSAESLALVSAAQKIMPGRCWEQVAYFAERGILVAPGAFYGDAAASFVRIALTATDERISAVASRLV